MTNRIIIIFLGILWIFIDILTLITITSYRILNICICVCDRHLLNTHQAHFLLFLGTEVSYMVLLLLQSDAVRGWAENGVWAEGMYSTSRLGPLPPFSFSLPSARRWSRRQEHARWPVWCKPWRSGSLSVRTASATLTKSLLKKFQKMFENNSGSH